MWQFMPSASHPITVYLWRVSIFSISFPYVVETILPSHLHFLPSSLSTSCSPRPFCPSPCPNQRGGPPPKYLECINAIAVARHEMQLHQHQTEQSPPLTGSISTKPKKQALPKALHSCLYNCSVREVGEWNLFPAVQRQKSVNVSY